MGDCLVALTLFVVSYSSYAICEHYKSVSATLSVNALMESNMEEYSEYTLKRQLYSFAEQIFHFLYMVSSVLVCFTFIEGFIL